MKNIYKLLPLLAIGMILCFASVSNAQTKKKKTTSTKSTTSTPAEDIWKPYTITTQDSLVTKRNGSALIKFPITPNQKSKNSNNFSYEVNYKESDLIIYATYFATFQPVEDEGRMVSDLLPVNYGKIIFNGLKSQFPQDKYNLISYKNLSLEMDETKFSVVYSNGKIVYWRMRAAMRNRTLFTIVCKRINSLDDALCDKFFKSFSFTYK